MFNAFLLFGLLIGSEIYLFSLLSNSIGVFEMVYLSLLSGLLGAIWARKEGGEVLQNLISELQSGQAPQKSLLEGSLVLGGGLLLIAPGFASDLLGLLLIFPFSRSFFAHKIQAQLSERRAEQAQKSGVYDSEGYTRQTESGSVHFGQVKLGSNAVPKTATEPQESLEQPEAVHQDTAQASFSAESSQSTDTPAERDDDEIITLELDEQHTEETSKLKDKFGWDHPTY